MKKRYILLILLTVWLTAIYLCWDIPGVRFGLIDNGVLGWGVVFGVDYDAQIVAACKKLRLISRTFDSKAVIGAAVGGGLANLASDFLGGSFDMSITWFQNFGISLGCLLAMGWIPIYTVNKGGKL
jgi:hypothetical protein